MNPRVRIPPSPFPRNHAGKPPTSQRKSQLEMGFDRMLSREAEDTPSLIRRDCCRAARNVSAGLTVPRARVELEGDVGKPSAITATPSSRFECWKTRSIPLDEQPRDDCVSDRDLVNVAPLKLSEDIPQVHEMTARSSWPSDRCRCTVG
jgi:hypothetical protein